MRNHVSVQSGGVLSPIERVLLFNQRLSITSALSFLKTLCSAVTAATCFVLLHVNSWQMWSELLTE